MKRILLITLFLTLFITNSSFTSFSYNTQTPIKHIIIIIQENHSFDNLFGTYPFGYPSIVNNITLSVMFPQGLYTNYTELKQGTLDYISVPNVPWLPIFGYSHPYYANSYSTEDPNEGWTNYHGDYWFDTFNGFVFYSGPQSMAYFSYEQLAPLWDYAEEYVLADNYFSPVMGLTAPNRIAYLTGSPPSFYTDEPGQVIPIQQSIFYQLSEYNLTWKYYVYGYEGGVPYPLNIFIGSDSYTSHYANISQFYEDLKNRNLPSVSWVMFLGGSTDQYDMHPPGNLTSGEKLLVDVVNAVMESKEWNSTAIFITFDEGGGYFDQVTPPSVNYYGLGQRIPLLIISPYAKEGYVNNYTMSGYTLLGFIDYNFNLPYITTLAEQGVQGLLHSFNFNSPPRSPIILEPYNWTYPIPLQYPVHYGYIATVPKYEGYAEVYYMPILNFLLPLNLVAFAILILSVKFKRVLLKPSLIIFLILLGISAYVYTTSPIYQFVSEYYLASSFIGVVISSILFVKIYKKYLRR
ncbi:acid phosphatase [Sulfolobus acidocaldarius SUSAZ]|nr:acid phosphatase [Sulfolobus acidocaldarius SUSAZ]